MASFMRQKYQEESEEVRNNVKKRQEELKAELETEGEDKNHAYQNAINHLPRTLAVWGESVTKQTGWNITFLVGGPAPNQNGKIMSYLLHCGKSPEGQDFEAFLGEEEHDKHVITPFDDFLHESFPPEVCSSRSLGSKANTPEVEENKVEKGASKINNSEDEIIKSAGGDGVSANRTEWGTSEYERTREANIVKNKEILRELGLEFGFGHEADKATMKKGKKAGKEKKVTVGEETAKSARVTEPIHVSKSDTLAHPTNGEKTTDEGPIGNP
ncbi:hypothetical protein K443DRAFT_11936, partial [Laccaria amethystina LaAM-08-1]